VGKTNFAGEGDSGVILPGFFCGQNGQLFIFKKVFAYKVFTYNQVFNDPTPVKLENNQDICDTLHTISSKDGTL